MDPTTSGAAPSTTVQSSHGGTDQGSTSISAPTSTSPPTAPTATVAPTTTATSVTSGGGLPLSSAESYLSGRQGQTTVALLDGQTGSISTFQPNITEDTASIVKLEIMGAKLSQAQASGQSLSSTDSSLMTSMIENSDNDSATALWNAVGGPSQIQAFDQRLGMYSTSPSYEKFIPGTTLPGWGLTTTSALDQVKMVEAFAYPSSVLTPASREYGLSLMEHIESDQAWGVTGGVPPGVTVAMKNGWLPIAGGWQVNSVGWIDGGGRNYVLAVLSDGAPTEQYGIDTIDTVSADIYAALG